MNILHVLTSMDPKMGGVRQAVQSICIGLNHLGVQNEVACLDQANDSFLRNEVRFTIHGLGPARGPWARNRQLYDWLVTNISRFDIVIVHGLWQYHSYATWSAVCSLKRQMRGSGAVPRVFVMPHGMLDPYFQRAPERRLKAIRNVIYWHLIQRRLVNECDGILFTCEEEKRLAREPFKPYKPANELVVGLGVEEPPVDSMGKSSVPAGKQGYILFLGRIHTKKGVDLLIHAFQDIVEEFPTQRLVIAGPGLDTTYGSEALSVVEANPRLKEAVTFPGMVSGESKWAAFSHCDAFILPSHQENFGIAVVEALACGKPVLISDQVNIWQEIRKAGAGLVAEDTLEGTVSLLRQWIALPIEEKQKMSKRARELYLNSFAVDAAAKRLLDAIKNH